MSVPLDIVGISIRSNTASGLVDVVDVASVIAAAATVIVSSKVIY